MANSTNWSYNQLPVSYKYQLQQDYEIKITLKPVNDIVTSPNPFVSLSKEGVLIIKSGYAWDGPSGPTSDTPEFMRASLIHDALYQLMRDGYLNKNSSNRRKADKILKMICIEDGMSRIGAGFIYSAIRVFGNVGLGQKEITIKTSVPLKK